MKKDKWGDIIKRFFYIWIEGIDCRSGEKIKSISNDIEYTTKLTEALRIRVEDKEKMKELLRGLGIAEWVIESDNTFVRTSYAPKDTLFLFGDYMED